MLGVLVTQQRALHTHITQSKHPVEGCTACENIDPERMSDHYAMLVHAHIRRNHMYMEFPGPLS